VIVRYPKFDGSGYLALPVLRGADQQFVIDIDFRPDVAMTSFNATPPGHVELLLFSSDRDDAQFDFFSVTRLQNGQIEFRSVDFVFTDRVSREGKAIGSVCLSVRPSVCPSVCFHSLLTFELEFVCVVTIARLGLKVKVIGQRSTVNVQRVCGVVTQ